MCWVIPSVLRSSEKSHWFQLRFILSFWLALSGDLKVKLKGLIPLWSQNMKSVYSDLEESKLLILIQLFCPSFWDSGFANWSTKVETESPWALSVFSTVPYNVSLLICLFSLDFDQTPCAEIRQGKGQCVGQGTGSAGNWSVVEWPGTACCPLAPLPPGTGIVK